MRGQPAISRIYDRGEPDRGDINEREARAQAAAKELWQAKGLALIDPEDFEWPTRELIIATANKQFGKRGRA